MNKMDQKVWCIASEKLFAKGEWNGLMQDNLDFYRELLINEGEFRRRGDLEEDSSFKQVIGQVILQHENRFLIYEITKHGGESRLHDMWPLVVGGHIDEIDAIEDGVDLLDSAINREFEEEVRYSGKIIRREFLGLIYIDNDKPVNQVHVGVVYRFVGDSEDVDPIEKEIANMRFVDLDFIEGNKDKLTYWSRELVPLLREFENLEKV